MPLTSWGWEITPEEIAEWTLHEDSDLLVVNKPGLVVCHPSKHGPWSSLIGACREVLGVDRLHMPSRLDRETSGVVVFAKNAATASRLQTAIQRGDVHKEYHAILCGDLHEPVSVDQPIGGAAGSRVAVRRAVVAGGQSARTDFVPLAAAGGYTLARVRPHTGRMHQIRVHAAWLGHPVAGDKIYGPDETLFLEWITSGWTDRHESLLAIRRHALHASL
jgi:23S rRNA pseudouridine1911/1915/1917 synthase